LEGSTTTYLHVHAIGYWVAVVLNCASLSELTKQAKMMPTRRKPIIGDNLEYSRV